MFLLSKERMVERDEDFYESHAIQCTIHDLQECACSKGRRVTYFCLHVAYMYLTVAVSNQPVDYTATTVRCDQAVGVSCNVHTHACAKLKHSLLF